MKIAVVAVFCVLLIGPAAADTSGLSGKDTINTIFDCNLKKLEGEEFDAKIDQIERFYEKVRDDTATWLPVIRAELPNPDQTTAFLMDGANMLFMYSGDKADYPFCVEALSRVDFTETSTSYFMELVVRFAHGGANTWPAIEAILNYPDFGAFFAQHYLTLEHNDCIVHCCVQLDPELYTDQLIARLKTEKDKKIIKSILHGLGFTVTEKAYNALVDYVKHSKDKEFKELETELPSRKDLPKMDPEISRDEMLAYLDRVLARDYSFGDGEFQEYAAEMPYLIQRGDLALLHEIRADAARRLSDEALMEIQFWTALMQFAFASQE